MGVSSRDRGRGLAGKDLRSGDHRKPELEEPGLVGKPGAREGRSSAGMKQPAIDWAR